MKTINKNLIKLILEEGEGYKNEFKKNKGLIVVLSEGRYRIHKPSSK